MKKTIYSIILFLAIGMVAIAQDEKGWLAPETMQAVADYLGMPAVAVQEVATFYNMYHLKPMAKYKISVCTNLPLSERFLGVQSVRLAIAVRVRRMVRAGGRKMSSCLSNIFYFCS